MIRDQELYEKIEAYLNGHLSETEIKKFEKELKTNDRLRLEVRKHKLIDQALSDTSTLAFQSKLDKIRVKHKQKLATPFRGAKRWYGLAAAISGILIIGLTIYFSGSDSSKSLYQEYYTVYEIQNIHRGENAQDKALDPFNLYSEGNYSQAILGFQFLLHEPKYDQNEIYLYLGNCHLNEGAFDSAIETFKKVSDQSSYYVDATWYITLSYLAKTDRVNSTKYLNVLLKTNTIYDRPASKLLREIQ